MRRILVVALAGMVAACSGSRSGEVDTASEGLKGETVQQQVEVVSQPVALPGDVEVVGGDEESLREFIGRALTYPYPGAEEHDTVISIGLLPEKLPIELPLPEGSQVIGSIIRGEAAGTEIILDVPLKPGEAIDFYKKSFTREGWSELSEEAYGTGFVSEPWPSQTFCYGDEEIVIYISAVEIPDKPTDVRVNILGQVGHSPCDPDSTHGMDDAYFLIPSLKSPSGTLVQTGGSSSGQNEASVTASLKTDLSAEELADHYSGQLSDAGWALGEHGSTKHESWSSWTIEDEEGAEWGGFLIVVESPTDPEKRYAWFQFDKAR
ncbi:MAG: hypothetical protein WBB65_00840 [Anaerolineales bacterium]